MAGWRWVALFDMASHFDSAFAQRLQVSRTSETGSDFLFRLWLSLSIKQASSESVHKLNASDCFIRRHNLKSVG